MLHDNKILLGKGDNNVYLLPKMANRHGLITGATGTGKTVTLKVMAEGFSDMGVPVFLADIKGDVSSLSLAGTASDAITERLSRIGITSQDFPFKSYPCRFWDIAGKKGIPVRATVSDMGPLLLTRLLGLTDVQSGVLNIAFHVADDNGWELIDLKDLRAMLTYVSDHKSELTATYGNVSTQSVGAIQRALLNLQDQGGELFLGEPMLDINDWFATNEKGQGMINLLHCSELISSPMLYGTFMLWMLSELFETLPEVGDQEKPKIVFFFDEAHVLFNNASKALLEKIVQVVKLIRSKGVGIYFISQSPSDIPDEVLAQLNNRVQHALHAYTPAEQKAVKVAANSFRPNPAFKTEDMISCLATGEALISTLDENGTPNIVEKATILPPMSGSQIIEDAARAMLITNDPLYSKYKDAVDNISAYEQLNPEPANDAVEAAASPSPESSDPNAAIKAAWEKSSVAQANAAKANQQAAKPAGTVSTTINKAVQSTVKSTARSIGRDTGKQITRNLLGTSNKYVNNAAGTFAGNIFSNLIGGVFKK